MSGPLRPLLSTGPPRRLVVLSKGVLVQIDVGVVTVPVLLDP